MAIISDLTIQLELLPRKYNGKEDDPFIYSFLGISRNEIPVFNLFASLLLKSEYEKIVNNLSLLIENKPQSFYFESIEPFIKLHVHKQTNKRT
ncbi:hypothetical protein KV679_02145 [Bacillus sp. JRC01]|nr:hypothetical protein [Bacillus sp. JRC01]